MQSIIKLGGLTLSTPKFEESVAYYGGCFGLDCASRNGSRAVFDGARGEKGVLTIERSDAAGIIAFTLCVKDDASLITAQKDLAAAGQSVSDVVDGSFSVETPDGQKAVFVVDADQPDDRPTDDARPLFISHMVLNSPRANEMVTFFCDMLGFEVTDRYERDLLVFLKCDQPQHHCIAIAPGEAATLNHFSLETGSIDTLMTSVGRMQKAGYEPIWGPGRHGPGGNVFCYYEDPTGFVAEYTCDVLQIDDMKNWTAKEWPRVPDVANVWGTGGPSDRAVALMSGNQ